MSDIFIRHFLKNWPGYLIVVIILCLVSVFIAFINGIVAEDNQRIADMKTVVETKPVGNIQSITIKGEDADITTVNTDMGTFTVYGRFSYLKNSPVVVEKRKSGHLYVCVAEPVKQCNRIAK